MKKLAIAAVIVGAIAAASLSSAIPASAEDGFSFSFDVGNVRLGYTDGYWDSDHHWHKWRNKREAREFAKRNHDRYVADRHTRYQNQGWRDSDHDGIPDRLDKHPDNPRRD